MESIEIYCDSSFSQDCLVATCSCAIVSVYLPTIRYQTAVITRRVNSSTLGEMHAIVEGLYFAHKLHSKKRVRGFTVITDSKGAQVLLEKEWHWKPEIERLIKKIQALKERGYIINIVWMRGHQTGKTMPEKISNKVDKLARHELRQHIKNTQQVKP
jgi:ribonuclease HI